MLEGLKDALEHVEGLARENEKTEVIEICGHTYANKSLKRYDNADKATELEASSLTALLDLTTSGPAMRSSRRIRI